MWNSIKYSHREYVHSTEIKTRLWRKNVNNWSDHLTGCRPGCKITSEVGGTKKIVQMEKCHFCGFHRRYFHSEALWVNSSIWNYSKRKSTQNEHSSRIFTSIDKSSFSSNSFFCVKTTMFKNNTNIQLLRAVE